MTSIARQLGTYRVEVEGMISFYAFLSSAPLGEITIRLCDDIIDRHAGMEDIAEVFCKVLGVKPGETSSDGRFSLLYTACIGMSDQAPAGLFNNHVITNLNVKSAGQIAQKLLQGTAPGDLQLTHGEGRNSHALIESMVNNNIRREG